MTGLFQAFHDLLCLIGETEALVRSGIDALVVSLRQPVCETQCTENDQDIDRHIGAEPVSAVRRSRMLLFEAIALCPPPL